jgi:hypothetical protein
MADDRIEALQLEKSQNRTQRLVEMFQQQQQGGVGGDDEDVRAEFAKKVQRLAQGKGSAWTPHTVKDLAKLVAKVLEQLRQQAKGNDPSNPFAQHQALENIRAMMRQLMTTLNPPQEVIDSPEFQELMDQLRPKAAKLHKTGFERETMMKGQVRNDVLNRQVSEAVSQADRLATDKRITTVRQTGGDRIAIENASKSLLAMARMIQRRKKKRKKKVGDSGEAGEVAEAADEILTAEEAELLASLALDVMRTLREEIAPRWAPDKQPWLMNAADNEVYTILLAVADRELFEETEAFGEMQDLRTGQEVFTLRAADKVGEAVSRKKK